jgi:subtilisin family serine protease
LFRVLSPALAKNSIGVAGSDYGQGMAGYSSSGPTFDGRMKPDITLPGTGIMSVNSQQEGSTAETCDLRGSSGTSMATPAAAGSAALMRQYFEDAAFWATYCNPTYPLCEQGAFKPKAYLVIHTINDLHLFVILFICI